MCAEGEEPMIRVIREGVVEHRATCQNCRCQFTYERSDLHTNYLHGGEWVSCPGCGEGHRHAGATHLSPSHYPNNDYRVGRA